MEELYKIPKCEGYLLTRDGRVWSEKSKRWLSPFPHEGYLRFTFQINLEQKRYLLHRLLAYVFLDLSDLDDYSFEVHHVDHDKTNNSLSNLEVLPRTLHRQKHIDCSQSKEYYCTVCNKKLIAERKSGKCLPCIRENSSMITLLDILTALHTNKSWVAAGKSLGLSDNGLRKKYERLSGKSYREAKEHASEVFMDTCRSSKPR